MPAPVYGAGNPISLFVTALSAQQRAQACAAERRAQWAEYNAKKKAEQDAADAAAAQKQKEAAEQSAAAETARQAEAAEAARRQRVHAAAAEAARRRREQVEAQARRDRRDEEAQRRLRVDELIKAEQSPGNMCRDPKLARLVLEGWSNLDAMKGEGLRAIDIEHLTTGYFHADSASFSCHGVFVTNKGFRIIGTVEVRKNVAGDPLFLWTRDEVQDLSLYGAPPTATALSTELGGQSKLGYSAPKIVPAVADPAQGTKHM
jgi:hypothetical protein